MSFFTFPFFVFCLFLFIFNPAKIFHLLLIYVKHFILQYLEIWPIIFDNSRGPFCSYDVFFSEASDVLFISVFKS